MGKYNEASGPYGAEAMIMRYAVIYERAPNNYAAYAPDLAGCGSVGDSLEDVRNNIREAIEFHIDGMHVDNEPIPEPSMTVADALDYHRKVLAEYGTDEDQDAVDVEMVEVNVDVSRELATR